MDATTRDQARNRIRRVAGQVAAIERMIDEDRYCVDVLHQVAAARAALDGVGKLLLQNHVEHCVADAFASGRTRERKEKIAELLDVFSRFTQIGGR
jgi:DNA-binding FrmR family transcriptional regulator